MEAIISAMDFGDELNTVLTQPAEKLEGIERVKIGACDRYVAILRLKAIRCGLRTILLPRCKVGGA
jgi:hypothetical protein